MRIKLNIKNIRSNPLNFGHFKKEDLFVKENKFLDGKEILFCKNGNLKISYNEKYDHLYFSEYVDEEYLNNYYRIIWNKEKENLSLKKIYNYINFLRLRNFHKKLFNFKIKEISKLLDSNSAVLDIGCGNGELLNKLQCITKNLYGFEKSEYKDLNKSKYIKYFFYSLENMQKQLTPKSLDMIIMHHSLEHIFDQNSILNLSYNLLKDDGYLVVIVPDLAFINLFFSFLFLPHIHNFSKTSLQELLNRYNFQVVQSVESVFDQKEIFFISKKSSLIKKKIFKRFSFEDYFNKLIDELEASSNCENVKKKVLIKSFPDYLSKNVKYLSRLIEFEMTINNDQNHLVKIVGNDDDKDNETAFILK